MSDETDPAEPKTTFRASIEPPFVEEPACCAMLSPDPGSSILPMILVGIGVAYLAGMLTGSLLSNSSVVNE